MAGKRVWFKGEQYFLMTEDGNEGAIAPLHHCDKDGNILLDHVDSDSFAHLFEDGRILRYGKQIGVKTDLVEVEDTAREE